MPALNIIAIQETVLNSGFSSSLPSGMLPNRPTASQSTKTTKADGGEHEQPAGVVHHPARASPEAVLSDSCR